MSLRMYLWRLALSVLIDLLDFFIGRIPVVGAVGEGVGALALTALWGPIGLAYLGELADFTEQLDGFIPTATLIALFVGFKEGVFFGRKAKAQTPATRGT
jgi:hypothetical protein